VKSALSFEDRTMGRIVWIDATKGYAISPVVFGHVLGVEWRVVG
jgi:fucose 4-O-acetylase-like acetyltransferase